VSRSIRRPRTPIAASNSPTVIIRVASSTVCGVPRVVSATTAPGAGRPDADSPGPVHAVRDNDRVTMRTWRMPVREGGKRSGMGKLWTMGDLLN
jgi:hypothetical protein